MTTEVQPVVDVLQGARNDTGLTVQVTEVIRQTADAHTLVLQPSAGLEHEFSYKPGQFLTIHIPTGSGDGLARCYSLCSSPVVDEPLRITVKRTQGGVGSNWVCDNVTEGTTLQVLKPAGLFVPSSLDEDFLLFAGGSGITPVLSIVKSVLAAGSGRVLLFYANRDEDSVIFRDELSQLAAQHPDRLSVIHWLESLQGLPSQTAIENLIGSYTDREIFLCGPEAFMDCIQIALTNLNVSPEQLTIEKFTSLETAAAFNTPVVDLAEDQGDSSVLKAELDGETHELPWPKNAALLDVLLNAGVDAPFSCREGACSACACMVLEGEVEMERNVILEKEDLDDGIILGCQARPLTPNVHITYDA